MASYFDDNDLESVSEENLRYFYEEFSASVRKQLLSKNLMVPQNVYDVLYPRTKEALLAKNVVKITDLEESSKSIRDALVSKLVSQSTDLETMSETTRQGLLAKNKIIQEANDLLNNSISARKDLLSKNIVDETDLLKDSELARRNNTSKNDENISLSKNIDSNSDEFRTNNLSKNTITASDLSEDSKDFRDNNTTKNVSESNQGLDIESRSFRDNNLSKNVDTNRETLESTGDAQRVINLSKNQSTSVDDNLEVNSEGFRDNNISKNTPSESNIDVDSESYRKNNLNNNVSNSSDLEVDSVAARRQNESSNVSKTSDIETSSDEFRNNNIAANKVNSTDLETDSEEFRTNNVASNKSNNSDLLNDSVTFLGNNISANKPDNGDLEKDSAEFRDNNITANKSNNSDLLSDSATFLGNNISANKPVVGDLETESEGFRKNNVTANKPDNGDLLNDSATFLTNNVSANKPSNSDLLNDSEHFLQNNITANKPSGSDLETDSVTFLSNNISANKPSNSDLLADSEVFLGNNVSANSPNGSDLESDSTGFLANNVSANVPSNTDLLIDSEVFLGNNVSANVPNGSDLLTDSNGFFDNNVSANVPSETDLLVDSNPFLINNISTNVASETDLLADSSTFLTDNISANVPSGSDLLTDSSAFLTDNIAANVPSATNLLIDSAAFLDNNISANVPNVSSLEAYSKPFRDRNLASNATDSTLGVVIEGIGTSTFLGISKVFTQGIIIRELLKSKNKPSPYSIDEFMNISTLEKTNPTDAKNILLAKNEFQIGKIEYTQLDAGLIKGDAPSFYGDSTREQIQKQLDKTSFYNRSISLNLQNKYGINTVDALSPASIGGGFYSLDSVNPKGGFFDNENATNKVSFDVRYTKGSITDAIRNYNLSRNLYNLNKITPGDLDSMSTLQANTDEGFQGLIASTVGFLRGNDSIGSQLQGNLIPRGILVANEGAYIKGGNIENILKPEQPLNSAPAAERDLYLGTAASMMAQTVPGNPLMDTEFQAGTKGVKRIIKTIRDSFKGGDSDMTQNYFSQGEKGTMKGRKFVIGKNNDGTPRMSRQRFNVANPYKPGNAQTLLFSLENYSSGQSFYFPPYIQSFSDSYGANWNSVNFLGRPEPVFTYNNSTRDGNISFVVLTDYTQNLIIGRKFNEDSMGDVVINPGIHFTSKDAAQNAARELALNESNAAQQENTEEIKKFQQKQADATQSGFTAASDVYANVVRDLQKENNSLQKSENDALIAGNSGNRYSETNNVVGNVNDLMTSVAGRDNGDIDTKAEDSKKRIDEMIKNLAFQPSFFSGDKIDFQTKMDFLGKLTRPATADQGSGFSFGKPPVCHIHLGDWWNNDIVIDSVSFSYDDVPWTLDDGRVQPMWAVATINFKFVGPYRGQQGGPVLSNDKGGLYWLRGTNPNGLKTH